MCFASSFYSPPKKNVLVPTFFPFYLSFPLITLSVIFLLFCIFLSLISPFPPFLSLSFLLLLYLSFWIHFLNAVCPFPSYSLQCYFALLSFLLHSILFLLNLPFFLSSLFYPSLLYHILPQSFSTLLLLSNSLPHLFCFSSFDILLCRRRNKQNLLGPFEAFRLNFEGAHNFSKSPCSRGGYCILKNYLRALWALKMSIFIGPVCNSCGPLAWGPALFQPLL